MVLLVKLDAKEDFWIGIAWIKVVDRVVIVPGIGVTRKHPKILLRV